MHNAWEWAKSHPLWIAGGVLFTIILFWWLGRGQSSSPQSGIYAQTQDPNVVAANAAEQVAQTQANAQLSAVGLTTSAQTTQAQLQAQTLASYFTAASDAAKAQYAAAVTINGQNTQAATDIAKIQETQAENLAQTSANTAITLQTLNANTSLSLADLGLQSQKLASMTQLASQQLGEASALAQTSHAGSYNANANDWMVGSGTWAGNSLIANIIKFLPTNTIVTSGVTSPLGTYNTTQSNKVQGA